MNYKIIIHHWMNTYGNEYDNDVIIDLYLYVIIDV